MSSVRWKAVIGPKPTDGILGREPKFEPVDLITVDGVVIEDPDVEGPLLKIVGGHEIDTGREAIVQLAIGSAKWAIEASASG